MITLDMVVVLTLVVILLLLFFREILPIPITALVAASVLMLVPSSEYDGSILSPAEGLAGFSSTATIAVLAMFVLSAGVEKTGVIEAITNGIIKRAGKSLRRQLITLAITVGPISGFVNNTPIVAMMTPVTARVARHGGHSPSKLLMPMSFFSMLGGTLTIIGTSTNLLGNATLARYGMEPFGFFEFSVIGLIALAVGMLYFLLIGHYLLPDRGKGDLVERFDLKGFLAEFVVPEEEGEKKEDKADKEGKDETEEKEETKGPAKKTLAELGLVYAKGLQVVRITRGGARYDMPGPFWRLMPGDQLLIEGSRKALKHAEESGLTLQPEIEHPLDLDEKIKDDDLAAAEVVITTGSRYVGSTVGQVDFRNRHDVLVIAVRHQGRTDITPMSEARLYPGSVLLVQGTPRAIELLREQPDLYVTRERPATEYRKERLPHAVAIVTLTVLVAALGLVDIAVAALAGAALMVIVGCLRVDEFLRSIRWDIVLLLAGIIPLGVALEKTGTAALIGKSLIVLGGSVDPLVFLIILFLATSLITEVISNNASVVLLFPIAILAANGIGIDPRPVALTVMLAASTSMLTPIGYQTNTIVYGPGNYRFRDYARVGGPLNLILAVVIPFSIAYFFPL
jgi:di/tricarboxylate transporter